MGQTVNGYSIVFIPRSWEIGVWHKPNGYRRKKSIYALGPFRFVRHYALGAWKPEPPFEPAINRGVWLKGPTRPERLTGSEELAGNCMEPIDYNAKDQANGLSR